jgi:hypothetical protein
MVMRRAELPAPQHQHDPDQKNRDRHHNRHEPAQISISSMTRRGHRPLHPIHSYWGAVARLF